jgi:hypothetical protein
VRPQDDARPVIEGAREGLLDARGERGAPGRRRLEEDVAAGDVGGDVAEGERLEAGLEGGHADEVPAADVDPAQEGDEAGHAAS